MICKVRVIEHDGRETIYDAATKSGIYPQTGERWGDIDGGIGAIGYCFRDLEGVTILIHPESVRQIEIYKGDKQVEILKQRTHNINGQNSERSEESQLKSDHLKIERCKTAFTLLRRAIQFKKGVTVDDLKCILGNIEGASIDAIKKYYSDYFGHDISEGTANL